MATPTSSRNVSSNYSKGSSMLSVDSVASSLRSMIAVGLRYAGDVSGVSLLDDTMLQQYGPEQVLSRMLSMRTQISIISSQAQRDQAAQDDPPQLRAIKQIGMGQCGDVFALVGTDHVLKVAKKGKKDQLFEDCLQHKKVEETFEQLPMSRRPDINIPRFGEWIDPTNDAWWRSHDFSAEHTASYALVTGRIFPLPEPVRSAMFEQFAPSQIKGRNQQDMQLAMDKNKDCLVRVYLGRRQKRTATPDNFKLRNFDLMVNEMEFLRLPVENYAITMAQTLAVLHWGANNDANDIEFVFGSRPLLKTPATSDDMRAAGPDGVKFMRQNLDFTKRSIDLWLLDFNQCKRFPDGDTGVNQLVEGFCFNDPYYPRPSTDHEGDQKLWETFRTEYLESSAQFENAVGRAHRFIHGVETEMNRRSQATIGRGLFS